MIGLPRVSGKTTVKVLQKIGFRFIRQHGSHMIMRRDHPFAQTTIPNHKEIDRGTLRAIIRQVGLSVNEFNELLK